MPNFQAEPMKLILATLAALLSLAGASPDLPARPKITGIDHVRLYVSSIDKSRAFYGDVLGLPASGGGCSGVSPPCFPVNWYQQVELAKSPTPAPQNWLAQIAFATDDVTAMRRYLLAHGVTTGAISKDGGGRPHFEVRDPEGTPIAFVESSKAHADYEISSKQLSSRMFHAGFVVKDLAKENQFYVDMLGFRLYWYGGFKDDGTDWYEIQVPEGDDWIEYMLNISPDADHKELGIQNHFSLGVKNAQSAAAELRARGLSSFDGPEVGRDGKSSLDAYDPDGTRVEVMEFTPAQAPCCHAYTASHPKP